MQLVLEAHETPNRQIYILLLALAMAQLGQNLGNHSQLLGLKFFQKHFVVPCDQCETSCFDIDDRVTECAITKPWNTARYGLVQLGTYVISQSLIYSLIFFPSPYCHSRFEHGLRQVNRV